MGKRTFLTQDEIETIRLGLEDGRADQVFEDLAVYLERNELKLSDDVLRLYADKELFACFKGRGQNFADLMTN